MPTMTTTTTRSFGQSSLAAYVVVLACVVGRGAEALNIERRVTGGNKLLGTLPNPPAPTLKSRRRSSVPPLQQGMLLNYNSNDDDEMMPVDGGRLAMMMQPDKTTTTWLARAGVLTCAAVYGTNFAEVKTLNMALPASMSASMRFGLAALAATPILANYLMTSEPSAERDKFLRTSLGIGLINAAGYIAQAMGLETVDASLSAFICSLSVVIVPVLDSLVLGKKAHAATWVGASLASLGVGLLAFGDILNPTIPTTGMTMGLALTMLQPLAFGVGFWRTEQLFNKEAGSIETPPLVCAALQLIAIKIAADLWLTCNTVASGSHALPLPPFAEIFASDNLVGVLLWTGLATTFATVCVETLALSKISARESTVLFSTEPLWGTAFAAVTLGERLSEYAAFGGALIIVACLTSALLQPAPEEEAVIVDVANTEMSERNNNYVESPADIDRLMLESIITTTTASSSCSDMRNLTTLNDPV